MKRRPANIYRAMHVSRLREPDLAELPLALDRFASDSFNTQAHIAERDDDIIVAMNVPERRVAGGHSHIPDPYEFILKFRMMTRLAA